MYTENHKKLEEIHNSLINGQHKQMVQQIDNYGLYDFFANYKQYLFDEQLTKGIQYDWFSDVVIYYHRITNR